jgi:membrane-anchored protein YejM (alkaline phosphatase superfamily)
MKKIIVIIFIFVLAITGYLFSKKPKSPENVILISLDTTRADYIDTGKGAYASTPSLKEFAKNSMVFEHAFSTTTLTLPSHLNVFLSKYPFETGVTANDQIYDKPWPMLQEVLKANGFTTAAAISLGTLASATGFNRGFDFFHENLFKENTFVASAETITKKAFQLLDQLQQQKFFLFLHYSDPHTPYAPPQAQLDFQIQSSGHESIHFNAYEGAIIKKDLSFPAGNHVIKFNVNGNMDDFSFFIIRKVTAQPACTMQAKNMKYDQDIYEGSYILEQNQGELHINCSQDAKIHLFQIIPILKRDAARKLYTEEVEHMDKWLGQLFQRLKDKKFLKNTMVIIFADHGEGLGERNGYFGHHRYLNTQFTHVPLLIYSSKIKPKRISKAVSLSRIAPTILHHLNIEDSNITSEKSIFKYLAQKNPPKEYIYAFSYGNKQSAHKCSVINWPIHAIMNITLNDTDQWDSEYYNLELSSCFTKLEAVLDQVIIKQFPDRIKPIQNELLQTKKNMFNLPKLPAKEINQDTENKLKALGYL